MCGMGGWNTNILLRDAQPTLLSATVQFLMWYVQNRWLNMITYLTLYSLPFSWSCPEAAPGHAESTCAGTPDHLAPPSAPPGLPSPLCGTHLHPNRKSRSRDWSHELFCLHLYGQCYHWHHITVMLYWFFWVHVFEVMVLQYLLSMHN